MNVRDLGGYPTADGRTTRWRRFLRADKLHILAEPAREELVGLGLRTVLDLRRGSDLAENPSVFAGSEEVAYHHVDFIGEGPVEASRPLEGAEWFGDIYCQWLDERRDQVLDILRTLGRARGRARPVQLRRAARTAPGSTAGPCSSAWPECPTR